MYFGKTALYIGAGLDIEVVNKIPCQHFIMIDSRPWSFNGRTTSKTIVEDQFLIKLMENIEKENFKLEDKKYFSNTFASNFGYQCECMTFRRASDNKTIRYYLNTSSYSDVDIYTPKEYDALIISAHYPNTKIFEKIPYPNIVYLNRSKTWYPKNKSDIKHDQEAFCYWMLDHENLIKSFS